MTCGHPCAGGDTLEAGRQISYAILKSVAQNVTASLAQLVEQGPFKPWVVGSSPTGSTSGG